MTKRNVIVAQNGISSSSSTRTRGATLTTNVDASWGAFWGALLGRRGMADISTRYHRRPEPRGKGTQAAGQHDAVTFSASIRIASCET
jgi:hypothetical protein